MEIGTQFLNLQKKVNPLAVSMRWYEGGDPLGAPRRKKRKKGSRRWVGNQVEKTNLSLYDGAFCRDPSGRLSQERKRGGREKAITRLRLLKAPLEGRDNFRYSTDWLRAATSPPQKEKGGPSSEGKRHVSRGGGVPRTGNQKNSGSCTQRLTVERGGRGGLYEFVSGVLPWLAQKKNGETGGDGPTENPTPDQRFFPSNVFILGAFRRRVPEVSEPVRGQKNRTGETVNSDRRGQKSKVQGGNGASGSLPDGPKSAQIYLKKGGRKDRSKGEGVQTPQA